MYRESFTRACLTVGEYAAMVAHHCALDNLAGQVLVDVVVVLRLVEYGIVAR